MPKRTIKLTNFEIGISLLIGFLTGVFIVIGFLTAYKPEQKEQSFVPQAYAAEVVSEPTPLPSPAITPNKSYTGFVSYYSHAGCLGCGEKQIMGNGQAFDENAMTLAVPCEKIQSREFVYNTPVIVTNLDNGLSMKATITDCGGFSKYNRIADLSKGLFTALDAKTDKTTITLEVL